MPSHDTLNRILQLISPQEFHQSYASWVSQLYQSTSGQLIHIDGKSMRGVNRGRYTPKHIVSAYSSDDRYVLAQESIIGKGNELRSFERLLGILDLENKIITIDAAGTYKHIAEQITSGGGDYVLQVKANQKNLLEEIQAQFKIALRNSIKHHVEEDFGHGRIEKRCVSALTDLSKWLGDELWAGQKSIICVQRKVYDKSKQTERESCAYYLSSLTDAELISRAIRQHWSVENNLHWQLDVLFREDDTAKRAKNLSENYDIALKVCLFICQRMKQKYGKSIKRQKTLLLGAAPSDITELMLE